MDFQFCKVNTICLKFLREKRNWVNFELRFIRAMSSIKSSVKVRVITCERRRLEVIGYYNFDEDILAERVDRELKSTK